MRGIPVATRMRNVPSVSVPKYHVALKLSIRVRTLVENKCRNTFCWMASARFRVLEPVPLRKIERHTRVPRKSSKYWSTVFAMLDPHEGIPRQRRYVGRAIDQKVAVVVEPDALPGQRLGCGTLDLFPVLIELAAVARTGDHVQLWLPRREATEMRADSAQREVAFLRVNDVDPRIHIERHGVERIAVGLARVDHGRRLKKYVGLQVLIRESRSADRRYTQRAQTEFCEKLPAA